MKKRRNLGVTRPLVGAITLTLIFATDRSVCAYQPGTHGEISVTAAARSNVDAIFKSQYGIVAGLTQSLLGNTIEGWIRTGSLQEDLPFTRALNHFHNPLLPWDQAGLTVGLQVGQSSVLWQQNPDQRDLFLFQDTWSWPLARTRFLDFLTKPTQAERDRALADTARALGQVMHLVQDATVPAHVRNDPHLVLDGYERRMEELRTNRDAALRARFQSLLSLPALLPSPLIFSLTFDPQAPVPIARLIDTDTFSGIDIATYTTGNRIGVAEYTNGGYVSDDTIVRDFAFPRTESLGPAFCEPSPCVDGSRLYFAKVSEGDIVSHFVARGALQERLRFRGQDHPAGYMLEDRTYEAAAKKLFPRAVGYSAGLLDYFFRGQFSADPASVGSSAQLAFDLRTLTPGEDFSGAVAIYYDNAAGQRVSVAGLTPTTLTLTATAPGARVSFTRPSDNPSDEYVIVLTGRLGEEDVAPGNPTGVVIARRTRVARQTTVAATSAALATAPDGSLILVWQQFDSSGRRLVYNRVAPDGTDIVAPVSIFTFGPGSFLHPPINLAIGPDGHAHLAFKQFFSAGATRIWYLRIGPDGAVLAGTIAAGTVETAVGAASLALDPNTGLPSIVYFEQQNLGPLTFLSIRAVHLDASGNPYGTRDVLFRIGAGGGNDLDVGTAATIDAAGTLYAIWIGKLGAFGDAGYNLYVPGPSVTNPIRLTAGVLRDQVQFDLFHVPAQRSVADGTLHLAWSHKIGSRPAVFYGTRTSGGSSFALVGEVPATPSADSRRPHFVVPSPTRTVLTWTRDFTAIADIALAEFNPSQAGFPTTRAATNLSNTAAVSTVSNIALTMDPLDGAERRVVSYIDASEGGNNVYLQFYSPLVLDVTPNPAHPDQVVTITGKGFGVDPLTEGRVALNEGPIAISSWSDTAITVTLSAGAASGPLVVEAQGAMSPEVTLEVLP